ncbi:MAG: Restriction alleviation protein Lar [Rhodoferax sp.]|nr:Restriction alleviation protein Lar [Rhodoferax sp.]
MSDHESAEPLFCPFCGGTAVKLRGGEVWCYHVECADCQAEGPDTGSATREDAIRAWNRRYTAPRLLP